MKFPNVTSPSTYVDAARIIGVFSEVFSPIIASRRPNKKTAIADCLVDFTVSVLALFPDDPIDVDDVVVHPMSNA